MNSELRNILNECSSELDDIEQRIDQLKVFDKESKYLTCYALIKACGTAEFVYRSIIADYFAKFQDDKIDQYIDNTVRKGSMSATYDNMLKLLQKFDDNWSKKFKQAIKDNSDGNKLIESAKSLVNNRHLFAHGRIPTATFLDIKGYYINIVKLIDIFDETVC